MASFAIIVLTGSDQAEDRERAIELGANDYVVKELLMRPPPALFDSIMRNAGMPRSALGHRKGHAKAKAK